jgi:hypothetical protein
MICEADIKKFQICIPPLIPVQKVKWLAIMWKTLRKQELSDEDVLWVGALDPKNGQNGREVVSDITLSAQRDGKGHQKRRGTFVLYFLHLEAELYKTTFRT